MNSLPYSSPLLVAPPPSPEEGGDSLAEGAHTVTTQQQHPDLAVFIRHLWTCLPPGDLQTAVYPTLSSWYTPDEQVLY